MLQYISRSYVGGLSCYPARLVGESWRTDVELVPIPEKQFLSLVGQTPDFALKVMRTLAQRLRLTNKSFG